MAEIIGIDHIYMSVSDLKRSESFYDVVMQALGFRKNEFQIDGERHVQYFNRHFGYVLWPARTTQSHDRYAPGLHHLCLRVESTEQVNDAMRALKDQGMAVTEARLYPEYAPDYFACFLSDPDGLRLESPTTAPSVGSVMTIGGNLNPSPPVECSSASRRAVAPLDFAGGRNDKKHQG